MAKLPIIAGLDIGSKSIKVLVAARKTDSSDYQVLAQIKRDSFGVRRGVVVDIDSVSKIIKAVVDEASQQIGRRIESVYTNINGSHIFSKTSHGLISVSRADAKISQEDKERVVQEAQTFSLSSNYEIFDCYPKDFIVDGEGGIKDPLGLKGVRLEVDIMVLGGFRSYLRNLTQAILGADLEVADIMASPLASANAVVSPQQQELGVAVLDIGAGTSSFSVFEEGRLLCVKVFPVGSDHITYDINIGLQTDVEIAEKIKKEYGSCIKSKSKNKDKIELEEGLSFNKNDLVRIVEARVSEIFELAKKELKAIHKEKGLPSGVVITGAGAKIDGLLELAKKEFSLPVSIGVPNNFSPLEDPLTWSLACGLVLRGFDEQGSTSDGKIGGVIARLKKMLKVFIP